MMIAFRDGKRQRMEKRRPDQQVDLYLLEGELVYLTSQKREDEMGREGGVRECESGEADQGLLIDSRYPPSHLV
jgi:hypothetical protein